jgi:hypothetical protein
MWRTHKYSETQLLLMKKREKNTVEQELTELGSLSLKIKRCWLRFIRKTIYITLHCMLKGPPSPQLYMRE